MQFNSKLVKKFTFNKEILSGVVASCYNQVCCQVLSYFKVVHLLHQILLYIIFLHEYF